MITKQELQNFRLDFQQAVKELEKQYEVAIHLGSINYNDNSFRGKLEVTKTTVEAKQGVVEALQKEWNSVAPLWGLKPEDFGKSYMSRGIRMTIAGLNLKARNYPIKLNGSDGKTYKSTPEMVKFHLTMETRTGI